MRAHILEFADPVQPGDHFINLIAPTASAIDIFTSAPEGDGRGSWGWLTIEEGMTVFGAFPQEDTYEVIRDVLGEGAGVAIVAKSGLVTYHPASPSAVEKVLDAPTEPGQPDSRAPWLAYTLANGDLFIGCQLRQGLKKELERDLVFPGEDPVLVERGL